jgi:hypothetical protein
MARGKAVDVDAAWEAFKQRIAAKQARQRIPVLTNFLKAAAVLLLLVGTGWMGRSLISQQQAEAIVQTSTFFPLADSLLALDNRVIAAIESPKAEVVPTSSANVAPAAKAVTQKKEISHKSIALNSATPTAKANTGNMLSNYHNQNDFICNGTPCPIEICIYQTIKCADGQPSTIATCNILQPDQSGQIPYKALTKVASNCAATVDEIHIKRLNTGETIVLNADSKPSTAQELFNYLTGQKKGDILAGIFHTDCNNHNNEQQLTLDNNAGSLILQ